MSKYVNVFTDGSSFDNSRKQTKNTAGGIGVFWGMGDKRNLYEPFYIKPITNNRAELYAVIKAIEIFSVTQDKRSNGKCVLKIHTDSMLLVNTMTKWIHGWKKRGWKKADGKKPMNLDLICHLNHLIEKNFNKFKVEFQHVRAHKKEPKEKKGIKYFYWFGNNQADMLAKKGSIKYLSDKYCSSDMNN